MSSTSWRRAFIFQSLLKPNAYIVTQGPTEETVTDFWRMVWQEKASCIVMLTKTFDFIKVSRRKLRKIQKLMFYSKVMCVQYWPASNELEETYGGIHIKVIQEEELANFRIRTFRLYKMDKEVGLGRYDTQLWIVIFFSLPDSDRGAVYPPVPFHRVALSLVSVRKCTSGVPKASPCCGWSSHQVQGGGANGGALQVSIYGV